MKFSQMSRAQQLALLQELRSEYEKEKAKGLSLDLSRGKPSPDQLDLMNDLFDSMDSSVDCYTEDAKEDLHQFTIISEGYHVETVRDGGVPVRDYHLSEMPYAFGTYVKEESEPYTYQNGKANYLNCARLDGTFVDEAGNKFYFANNSYSSDPNSASYTVYMRYESRENSTFVEGTIGLSYYEDFYTNERHDVALIYVMHGEWEPAEEKGTSAFADYQLMDFSFDGDDSFTFAFAEYFSDTKECDYDPTHFIPGTYRRISAN